MDKIAETSRLSRLSPSLPRYPGLYDLPPMVLVIVADRLYTTCQTTLTFSRYVAASYAWLDTLDEISLRNVWAE